MDIQAWTTTVVETGIKIIIALIILVIAFKIINKLSASMEKIFGKSGRLDKTITTTLGYVIRILLKGLVIMGLVNYLGINTSGIATIIASLGVGVGMAINGAIANFSGGLLILLTRPFRVGDFVDVGGTLGTIQEIRLVHTKLLTLDNKVIYLPNSTASNATIVNFSEKDVRRVDQVFQIAYENDYAQAQALLTEIAKRNPAVLADPAPFVRMSAQGASGIDITTRLWCKAADYWDVYFYMLETVKAEFDAAGISIPYQQIDVHMKN